MGSNRHDGAPHRPWVAPMRLALGTAAVAFLAGTAGGVSAGPGASLVGTWTRTTTCSELATALRNAGLGTRVAEMVVGNGFIPNVRSVDELADPAKPCAGAVSRAHSHFFLRNGEFGSLDWNGDRVDDGRYRITKPGIVTVYKEFPKVSFRYHIRGSEVGFTPLIPRGCATFRCAWAISVAYPGKTWRRR